MVAGPGCPGIDLDMLKGNATLVLAHAVNVAPGVLVKVNRNAPFPSLAALVSVVSTEPMTMNGSRTVLSSRSSGGIEMRPVSSVSSHKSRLNVFVLNHGSSRIRRFRNSTGDPSDSRQR